MPAAYIPSPVKGLWRLGPVVLHGYALCVVLGLLIAIWVAERRYRAVGGRAGVIIDLATVVVPVGLLGARLDRLIVDSQLYFGPGRDWVDILRIWDGGLGMPGAVIAGLAGAFLWCRREGVGVGPVLAAAVPGLALAQAVGVWGNWFAQSLYGPPSTWPWAVEISPLHRVPGYQSVGTFQPLFLYESIWDVLVGLLLSYLIRRLILTGDRALALFAGLYAVGWLGTQSLRLGAPVQLAGIRLDQLAVIAMAGLAGGYLYLTRARHGPEALTASPVRRSRRAADASSDPTDDMQPSPNASRTAGEMPRDRPAAVLPDEQLADVQPDKLAT
jgi:prolipoprotein diacylglyceryltransferase